MRIIRKVSDMTGKDVALATLVLDRPSVAAAVQVEDLDFQMQTYQKLQAKYGDDPWEMFFYLANVFFTTLSDKDEIALYTLYQRAKQALTGLSRETVSPVIRQIADDVAIMVQQTDLPTKLLKFVRASTTLRYPNLDEIGQRAHDREELTFQLDEYKMLTAISIACKMLSPIWGDFIYRSRDVVESVNKESHCLMTFMSVLEHPAFAAVHNKLDGYVRNAIAKAFKKFNSLHRTDTYNLEFTLANTGFNHDRFVQHIYAMLCIKKLAIYDPQNEEHSAGDFNKPADIMKYIMVNISTTIPTAVTQLQKSSRMMARKEPGGNADLGGEQHDSITVLESESRVSNVPIDVPILAQLGALQVIDQVAKELRIPMTLLEDAVAYYERNLLNVSPFTRTIVTTMLGARIGGAKTFQYLNALTASRLVALVQLYMAPQWPHQMIHMLTAGFSADRKVEASSPIDGRIRMTYDVSSDYKAVMAMFPYQLGRDRTIKAQIAECISFITERDHFYNTAPAVCEYMDIEVPERGTPVVYDEYIINQLCEFLLTHSGSRQH